MDSTDFSPKSHGVDAEKGLDRIIQGVYDSVHRHVSVDRIIHPLYDSVQALFRVDTMTFWREICGIHWSAPVFLRGRPVLWKIDDLGVYDSVQTLT